MDPAAAVFTPGDYFREVRIGEIFPDPSRPLEVDLGCGDGWFLEQMAALHPDRNFLGVERLIGRIDKTSRRLARRNLENARVLRLETAYTIAWLLPAGSVSRAHLLCPDPWPKKAHRRNRIINDAEFLGGLGRVVQVGGDFLLKSDDADFFENALESVDGLAGFERSEWPDDAFPYPTTTFERQWLALGKIMHRARWRRIV